MNCRNCYANLLCILLLLTSISCKKSTDTEDDTGSSGGSNTTTQPGGADKDNKASGKNCTDTVWITAGNYKFTGYTFYVDRGYVLTGNGIVAAISGSPEIKFNTDSTYSVIKDSTSYFASYLSNINQYRYDGLDTLSFNSYTQYHIVGYKLCGKTEVYRMTQYNWNDLYNRLDIYRNY